MAHEQHDHHDEPEQPEHHHTHEHDHAAMTYQEAVEDHRAHKDAAFRHAPQSPIPPAERAAFAGLAYYPVDPAMEIVVPGLRPPTDDEAGERTLVTSDGQARQARLVGWLDFELDGGPQQLAAFRIGNADPDSLFVPFADATSGPETYGAGRYLDLEIEPDGSVVLDFNLAYHPFCAYAPQYSCPFPPPENRLPVRVTAGERLPAAS
jgi:hypothetical protein